MKRCNNQAQNLKVSLQINTTGYTARPQTGVRPSCLPMTARDGLAYECPSQSAITRPEDGMTALCIKHWRTLELWSLCLLGGTLKCTRTQWDKLKILRMIIGDVFLWNVSKKLVISCAHIHWRRVYQRAYGWAITGKLHLQRKMVESNDSLRFKLTTCNCFRCKAYSNVVFHCCHIFFHHTSRKNTNLSQVKITSLSMCRFTHRRPIWCVKCQKFCVSTHAITLTRALLYGGCNLKFRFVLYIEEYVSWEYYTSVVCHI